jgi:class 3 adenylate cyclase/ribosomal protein L40E
MIQEVRVAWFPGKAMPCSKCGTNNPSTNNFCAKCGNALVKHCAKCKAETPPTSDFCGKCGAPLTNGAVAAVATSPPPGLASNLHVAPESSSPEALDGERKNVTALFADIKGSMELIEDLDPEEARRLVDPALKLMMDAVHRYEGYVAQSTGDGIFALFGAPVAHEDHPQRALHAARRMQDDLKRYADRLRERGQPPLSVRVGVNSGEVVVRSIQTGDAHTEYTPIGHSISLAARLQTLAAPGSVVIGESVRKFVEGYFQLKALGAGRIKGVSEPVEVFEVTGLGPLRTRLQRSAGRGLTKFVGREREMEALSMPLRWPGMVTDRSPQLWLSPVLANRGCSSSSSPPARRAGSCSRHSRFRTARPVRTFL